MSLRISQRQIYNSTISHMNNNLSELMESNMQSSSQKKVNRPSDDPLGMSRILSYRSSITAMQFNQDNIKAASGWLAQADSALLSTSEVVTKMKSLAEQAATGTMSAENRAQIAVQVRELMGTLINLANTEYSGSHIFGGHKVDEPAYTMGLNVSTSEAGLKDASYDVNGGTQVTTLMQFTSTGPLSTASTFRYSIDGGKNWLNGSVTGDGSAATPFTLNAGSGTTVVMRPADGTSYPYAPTVNAVDITSTSSKDNGTWLYVRPTAIYHGDTNDNPPEVRPYPSTSSTATAAGYFTGDVAVKIVEVGAPGGDIKYAYSTDDGKNWVQASAPLSSPRLPVPGGFLDFTVGTPVAADKNSQYVIHPERADINFEVGPDEHVRVNNVGKDIFGGIYKQSATPNDPLNKTYPIPALKDKLPAGSQKYNAAEGEANNLFEVVGRFIAAAETNSQAGCQEALADFATAQKQIVTAVADVAGRENRVQTIDYITSFRIDAERDGLSKVEDVDISELMTRLAQQQLAYNAVLKSSSMVMQMSLLNFI